MVNIENAEMFNEIIENAVRKSHETCDAKTACRWERAITKAVREIQENPYLHYDTEKRQLIILSSNSGNIYAANGVCQCAAYNEGVAATGKPFPCWHRACARLVRLYLEATGELPKTPAPVARIHAAPTVAEMDNAFYAHPAQTRKVERIGAIRI